MAESLGLSNLSFKDVEGLDYVSDKDKNDILRYIKHTIQQANDKNKME